MRRTFFLLLFFSITISASARAADAPATTQPAQTGEIDLTFTERSPLSTPAELKRRLVPRADEADANYDLSKCPFKAYVPTNYDPKTPVGIIVYLGYKDTTATPEPWQPVLEKSHLIFISSVAHHGDHYSPSVPLAQAVGLAMDAIYNLKKLYAIDEKRIYEMSLTDGGPRAMFALSDMCSGFIVGFDTEYYSPLAIAENKFFPPTMHQPPSELKSRVMRLPIFFADGDGDSGREWEAAMLRLNAMKGTGFSHVMLAKLSLEDDVHYPNLKAEWFEQQALPFLDGASKPPAAKTPIAATKPGSATKPASAAKPVEQSEPQHLLSQAHLYLNNNRPDIARTKLQQILTQYPNDPAAVQAKQLLDGIGN